MCFWYGLEILKLVYKKAFFEMRYWTVSILFDLLSSEKSSAAPYKSWKKISSKFDVQSIKRSGILRWFKKCAEVSSLEKGKIFLQKTWIFRDLENFAKNCFSEKNLWELLDARVLHIFEISEKFCFFWYPLHPISKKFFSTLSGMVPFFWKLKGQIR